MQQRKTYAKLPLHANFYPVTTQAYLQDANVRLSLLTSQSLGAASFKQGMYEQILRFIPTAYWKILNLNKLEKYVVCYAVVHQELCCTADHFPAIGNVCTSFFFFSVPVCFQFSVLYGTDGWAYHLLLSLLL